MNHPLRLILLLAFSHAAAVFAGCPSSVPVSGSLTVEACEPKVEKCVSASRAVHDYADMEDDSTTFSIAMHSSPWRMYGPDARIMSLDQLAELIRQKLTPRQKSVLLMSSWTGVAPSADDSSVASKLSRRLGGFPVQGQDGFVWLTPKGSIRTTRQAFTLFQGSYGQIKEGSDVFVSMTAAGAMRFEDRFVASKNGDGMLDAGMAWDVFSLCPDNALDRFVVAAGFGNAIAAYNAGVILLERKTKRDSLSARKWLHEAARRGDQPSQSLLSGL